MNEKHENVVRENHGDFAVIRWNRPARKNAILPEMQKTLMKHLNELAKDDSIKLVVLTGTGEYYTSGADFLKSNISEADLPNKEVEKLDIFKDLVDCLIDFPKPLIAAVNGPAIGMGVTTLPLCDIVYASSDSTFVTPFSRIGLIAEGCSSYTFPRIMGYAKATEMLLFNRTISASQALACGLLAEIFPKETLMKEVYKRIHEFLDNPYMCLVYGKQLIRGQDRQKLHEINAEEVKRLKERALADDVKLQAMKFIQRRMEIKSKRNAKL